MHAISYLQHWKHLFQPTATPTRSRERQFPHWRSFKSKENLLDYIYIIFSFEETPSAQYQYHSQGKPGRKEIITESRITMPTEAVREALPASGTLRTEMRVKALSPRLLHKTKSLPLVLLLPQFPPKPGKPSPCPDGRSLLHKDAQL